MPKLTPTAQRELALFGLRVKAGNHYNALVHNRNNPIDPDVAYTMTIAAMRKYLQD